MTQQSGDARPPISLSQPGPSGGHSKGQVTGVPTYQAAAELAAEWRDISDCVQMARDAFHDALELRDRGLDGTPDDRWDNAAARALNGLDELLRLSRAKQLAHEHE